jgi:type IX secretion system PorP/SprF family membrane protein
MRLITILFFVVFLVFEVKSQQATLNSQFMNNKFLLNPAFAGTQPWAPIFVSVRRQWVGIREAPITQFVSFNTSLDRRLGMGANLYNEATGPTRRTGVNVAGAYHFPFRKSATNEHYLSLGMSMSITQLFLDKTRLETYLPDDPTIIAASTSQVIPDANFGAYYHNADRYFAALSIHNLIQPSADIYNVPNVVKSKFVRNYYLMGGVNLDFRQGTHFITYQPTLLVQGIEAKPVQFELSNKFIYDNQYWFGFGYRHLDAVVVLAGFEFKNFQMGYSYDLTLSKINSYSTGSHEINFTYMLGRKNGIRQRAF